MVCGGERSMKTGAGALIRWRQPDRMPGWIATLTLSNYQIVTDIVSRAVHTWYTRVGQNNFRLRYFRNWNVIENSGTGQKRN